MFEILGIIALSILAVIMAAVGVGMASETGRKNKKSLKSSISNPFEKINEGIENVMGKGMKYTGNVVKRANENEGIKSTAAAYKLLSGVYHTLSESNVRDMPEGFWSAVENMDDTYNNPVRHLGKWGALADYIFLGSSLDEKYRGITDSSSSKPLSIKDRLATQRTIEKYLESEGLGKYNVKLEEELMDEGRTAGVTKGNKMTLARFTKDSKGKRAQTGYDLFLTAKHERFHQRQEELGAFAGEEYVEAATLLDSKKKREEAYAKGDYIKAEFENNLYKSNIEYILRQRNVDTSYYSKLMSIPEISKEVRAYKREKAERNRDVV